MQAIDNEAGMSVADHTTESTWSSSNAPENDVRMKEAAAAAAIDEVEPNRVLGVFGLSYQTKEADLEQVYAQYGPLEKVTLIFDHGSRQSKGFGFVTYKCTEETANQSTEGGPDSDGSTEPKDAAAAATGPIITMAEAVENAKRAKDATNGMELHSKIIRVDFSKTKTGHAKTPGEYRGRVWKGQGTRGPYDDRGSRYGGGGRDRERDRDYERSRYRDDYRRDRYYDDRRYSSRDDYRHRGYDYDDGAYSRRTTDDYRRDEYAASRAPRYHHHHHHADDDYRGARREEDHVVGGGGGRPDDYARRGDDYARSSRHASTHSRSRSPAAARY